MSDDRCLEAQPVRQAEAALLSGLHAACFEVAWSAEDFEALLSQPTVWAAVGRRDDCPTGFGLCRQAADEVELLTFAVLPAWRRRGIAAEILQQILSECLRRGANHLFLEVAEGNLPARRFYRKWSFFEFGRRPGYYRHPGQQAEDAILMRYDLLSK